MDKPLTNSSKDIETDTERVGALIRVLRRRHHNLTSDHQLKGVPVGGFLKPDRQSGVILDLAPETIKARYDFTDKRHRRQETNSNAHTQRLSVFVLRSEDRLQECRVVSGI